MIPRCNLPRDIAGKWFTQGPEFKSDVAVNETHIHYHTGLNEFEFQDAFYSCQQTLGTRYLMTKVLVGKWWVAVNAWWKYMKSFIKNGLQLHPLCVCLVYVMLAFLCNHFQLLKDSILNFYTVYRINFAYCNFCHFVLANSFSLKFSQTHFSFCSRLLKIRPFFNSPSDNEGEKGRK